MTPLAFAITIAVIAVVCLGIGLIGGMFITQKHQAKAAEFAIELKTEYKEHRAKIEKWLKDVEEKFKDK